MNILNFLDANVGLADGLSVPEARRCPGHAGFRGTPHQYQSIDSSAKKESRQYKHDLQHRSRRTGSSSFHLDGWVLLNVFLAIAAVVRDGAGGEIDVVSDNSRTPGRS